MRDYNYRMDVQEKFVKKRILNFAYQREYYNISTRRRRNYHLRDPEDKWFNYLGEYTKQYRKSRTYDERKWRTHWGENWKEKYLKRRSRLKENILNKINEQIGQEYYIFNK